MPGTSRPSRLRWCLQAPLGQVRPKLCPRVILGEAAVGGANPSIYTQCECTSEWKSVSSQMDQVTQAPEVPKHKPHLLSAMATFTPDFPLM